ncbi:MAG: hypothetical protein HRU11_04090 [Parvularculaceae bacterium]|nr:hypothetical protein [Parvularculaceae bacterium]
MLNAAVAVLATLQAQADHQIHPPLAPPFDTADCATETAESPVVLSSAEKAFGVSQIWSLAHQHFPFFDQVPDLDWDAQYATALTESLAAETCFEYGLVLQRFIAHLDDGHTGLAVPSIAHDIDYVPIDLRSVSGKPVLYGKPKDYLPRVPLGSELLSIDGRDINDILEKDVYPYVAQSAEHVRRARAINGFESIGWGPLVGEPGSMAKLRFRTPEGKRVTVRVKRDANQSDHDLRGGDWMTDSGPSSNFEYRWIDDELAYVNLPSFASSSAADQFEEIAGELTKAKHVIVDLRSNGGGSTGNGVRVLRYFAERELQGSAWRTRQTNSAHVAWGHSFELYGGSYFEKFVDAYRGNVWLEGQFSPIRENPDALSAKLIVLIGPGTASAAEDFLVYADGLPSATVVGQPTFGSTGQPILFELPGKIRGRLVTKRDSYPDGRDFVGYGIQPDVQVDETVDSLLSETDIVLDRAIEIARADR